MEADSSHSMLLKEVRESCCQIFRLHQFSEFVHEDVVLVLLAVTVSAQSLIRSLLVLQGIQCFFKGLNDRQRSERGFGLGTILRNDRGFAVQTSLCNHMTNSKDLPLKVNRIPLQSAHFAPTQAVERCKDHRQFKDRSFDKFKELLKLLTVVRIHFKAILSRTLHLIRRIRRDQINLIRILQCLPDVRMAMNDCICAHAVHFHFIGVIVLNVLC